MDSNNAEHSHHANENEQNNKKENNDRIREGQKDSAINDNDHIKHKSYPETSLRDKQLDNQDEFITPPNEHPGKDS